MIIPSGFPTKILYAFLFATMRSTYPVQLIPLDLIILTILGEEYKCTQENKTQKNIGINTICRGFLDGKLVHYKALPTQCCEINQEEIL
jgi:hypothetical protein